MKKKLSSDVHYEDIAAYSRAVRVGNTIEVSGTTSASSDGVLAKGDAYQQSVLVLEKVCKSIEDLGGKREDIVRTRIYTTDIEYSHDIMKAHKLFFDTIRPAATLVVIASLVHPDMLVEIEATAIIDA